MPILSRGVVPQVREPLLRRSNKRNGALAQFRAKVKRGERVPSKAEPHLVERLGAAPLVRPRALVWPVRTRSLLEMGVLPRVPVWPVQRTRQHPQAGTLKRKPNPCGT